MSAQMIGLTVGALAASALVLLVVYRVLRPKDSSSRARSEAPIEAKVAKKETPAPILPGRTPLWVVYVLLAGAALLIVYAFMVQSDGVDSNFDMADLSWNAVAPYILAPLFGWFVYNFSNKHYHNVPVAVGATLIGIAAIFLWLHPEILTAVIEPFGGTEAGEQLMDGDAPDWLTRIAVIAFILAILSGYVLEAIVFLILFLILF